MNNRKRNVLYIAMCAPYDSVSHAGGQTLNFYIKNLAKQDNVVVDLVTYIGKTDMNKMDLEHFNINVHPIIRKYDIVNFVKNIFSINSKLNPFHKYCNLMTRNASHLLLNELKKLERGGYNPDIIIMEWTQIVLQIDEIKSIFPKSKYIASEHDVTFLGAERKRDICHNIFTKFYRTVQYYNTKKRELTALAKCDLIMTHSKKDEKLLVLSGIDANKIFSLIPYYHRSKITREQKNNDILYFGYMKRNENLITVEWFIDKVLPLIEDVPCRFVILGGGTPESLKNRASNKIVIGGYVPVIDEYFAHAMCFAAPIQLGAGIKVKILEAMYSGIPVLTNDLGIEGIPAVNGTDYIHCNTAEEYAEWIRKMAIVPQNNEINGKELILKEFSLDDAFEKYLWQIESIEIE